MMLAGSPDLTAPAVGRSVLCPSGTIGLRVEPLPLSHAVSAIGKGALVSLSGMRFVEPALVILCLDRTGIIEVIGIHTLQVVRRSGIHADVKINHQFGQPTAVN